MFRALRSTDLEPTLAGLIAQLDDRFLEQIGCDLAEAYEPLMLTSEQEARLLADVLENYRLLAQSPLFTQRSVVDCFVMATLSALDAMPDAARHLRSLIEPLGGGLCYVTLIGIDAAPMCVVVGAPSSVSASADATIVTLERAIATANAEADEVDVYGGATNAALVLAIMAQLGLTTVDRERDALAGIGWRRGDSVRVGVALAEMVGRFALQPLRTYTVVGGFHHRETGEPMVVLHDPWSEEQPAPVPARTASDIFACSA